MLQNEDLNNQLLNKIFSMSQLEQEKYFSSLNRSQLDYVTYLLHSKARPAPTCELMDGKANFVDWITSHFYVPELNGPIWLHDYQKLALAEATSLDKNGLYKYSLIAWTDIKKSIKSCIAAAVALRMAFKTKWGSIKVVANKREQAQSRSYFYITRALKLNPETRKMINDGLIKISNYTIKFLFNDATIQAIPLNPEGEAGGNDDCIIWTEAWAAKSKAAQTMYTEMVIPPNKFGKGFKWIESYAGHHSESPILEPIYDETVKQENQIENTDMYIDGRTFMLCNHTPKLPWQTKEYYIQQAKELTETEFRRVHRNEWQSATNTFIDSIAVDKCKGELPPLKPKQKLVLGVDAAYAADGDCFAVVGVTKFPKYKVAQRISKVWRAGKDGQLKFRDANDLENPDYPYGYLLKLCKEYNVVCIVYDPTHIHDLASEFTQKRIAWMYEFTQGKPREQADNDLYHLIRDNQIIINDDTVIKHIKNANSDTKGRLIKRNKNLKIDAAVALAMACFPIIGGKIRI